MPVISVEYIEPLQFQPPDFERPKENEISIWRIPVASAEKLLKFLTASELRKKERYKDQNSADQFVAARGGLRYLLSIYTDQASGSITIDIGTNGKPYLKDHPDLHFNSTHAVDYVLIAFSDTELGIDLTSYDSKIDHAAILQRCFSLEDQQLANDANDPAREFSCLWARKEALLKATGLGIHNDLHLVSIGDGNHNSDTALIGSAADWTVQSFDDAIGCIAVAYPGEQKRLHFFNLPV